MKITISIFLTTIVIFSVIGCASSAKEDKTQIHITCVECAGMEVSLTRSDILPVGLTEIYQSTFDSSGRAKIEFVQNDTLSRMLVVGTKDQAEWNFYTTLYFEPGVNIDLTIKNGIPEFEGDLKTINSYYTKINLVERERANYANADLDKHITASTLQIKEFLDSLTRFGTGLLDQIKSDKSISEYHRKMLIGHNALYEITQRMFFETQVSRIERSNSDTDVLLDSTSKDVFKDLTLHSDYMDHPYYIHFLSKRLMPIFDDVLNFRYEHGIKTNVYEDIKATFVKDRKLNDHREILMALFITHMSYDNRMDYDLEMSLIDMFQKDYPKSKYQNALNYILTEYHELSRGMPMKDLQMHDTNGKTFKLSDLKGNLVYIDIWATWCGPCVDELKYAVKLSEKYSGKPDLKFLYISVDEDTASWKKFLRKNARLKGIHGLQNSRFLADSNMVFSLYKISGIPRYILIDKNGKIVTANARRPSQLLSTQYLDSLLSL